MRLTRFRGTWQRLRLRFQPAGLTKTQRRNFFFTQMDAVGVAVVMAVDPFLAVFLTRLGATNEQVGLLSALPGAAGIVLGLVVGGFLQTRKNIVPWYSVARFIRLISYAGVGIASLIFPPETAILLILGLWFLASIPQSLLNVAFSVLMSVMGGPRGRYRILSRRWSTIGVIGALMTIVVGQVLDRIPFPRNYQLSFILFAVTGAAISYVFSSRFSVPDNEPSETLASNERWRERLQGLVGLVWAERPFRRFVFKRLVYIMGSHLVMPLFALYYVRELQATDAQISIITTVQKATLLVGYYAWTRLRERRGPRFVLLATTLAMALYPAVTAATRDVWLMIVLAGLSSVFQAGINLVFFDELMRTVPEEHSPLFVSVVQTLQNVQAIIGPLVSTWLSGFIGLGGALLLGAGFRFLGFSLFLFDRRRSRDKTPDDLSGANLDTAHVD